MYRQARRVDKTTYMLSQPPHGPRVHELAAARCLRDIDHYSATQFVQLFNDFLHYCEDMCDRIAAHKQPPENDKQCIDTRLRERFEQGITRTHIEGRHK